LIFIFSQGAAYLHVLSKVMMMTMLESTCILGEKARDGSTPCSVLALPPGKAAHPADDLNLVAIATRSKVRSSPILFLSLRVPNPVCFCVT
jgi:hypothetical protein